jgi:hypothetical protein
MSHQDFEKWCLNYMKNPWFHIKRLL